MGFTGIISGSSDSSSSCYGLGDFDIFMKLFIIKFCEVLNVIELDDQIRIYYHRFPLSSLYDRVGPISNSISPRSYV